MIADVVHRDIKPDNVLDGVNATRCHRVTRDQGRGLPPNGCSKILEKGVTTTVQSKRGYEQLMDSFVGTKVYAAPEILRHKPYDATVDEYSMGVSGVITDGEASFVGH